MKPMPIPNHSTTRSRRVRWSIALGIGACLAVVTLIQSTRKEPPTPVEPIALQGELIETPPSTNEIPPPTETTKPKRRERYKPGSLPQRLVQSQYRMLASGETNRSDPTLAPTNLPPEVLLQTVDWETAVAPDKQGYRNVGFDFLAGFDFELTSDLGKVQQDTSAAGQNILAQIPESVRKLHQTKVRLRGFLVPVFMKEGRATEFLLMRDQTLCCYGTIPTVNQWVHVRAPDNGVEPIMDAPLTASGTLQIGDRWENGYFTGIYLLEADQCQFGE